MKGAAARAMNLLGALTRGALFFAFVKDLRVGGLRARRESRWWGGVRFPGDGDSAALGRDGCEAPKDQRRSIESGNGGF